MRKLMAIAGVLAVAGVALAAPQYVPFVVRCGTNATAVLTHDMAFQGYVDEVYIMAATTNGGALAGPVATATVTVVSYPAVDSGLAETVLYTNAALTAATKLRPRVTQTGNTGSDLSSLTVAERFLWAGDTIRFRVLQASGITNAVWKCWLKIDSP